ncbi:MAG: LysR family transcriptional regulator [Candidatus Limivivens sp.]|nr:LysR family transcriptional regulator [Candidatus Limivivens sp.]
MNLNQLIYASKINRLGSFSRAARALYISQSTLSKSIRALEEEMEHEIFIRTPDGIVTTDFGRALLAEAEKIIQHMENIQNLAAHSGQISGQPLHFSASCGQMMFASEIFARLLGKYRNDKTNFRFYQKSYSDVFLDVKEERSNLGIVMTLDSHTEEARELFRQNDMDYYTLRRLKIGVAVSLNNPLNNMGLSRLRKEHLADQTLLLTQESGFPFTKEAPEFTTS